MPDETGSPPPPPDKLPPDPPQDESEESAAEEPAAAETAGEDAPAEAGAAEEPAEPSAPGEPAGPGQPGAVPPVPPPPPPPAGGGSTAGTEGPNTVMLALSYLWLLALIPFLTEQEDAEVQWHAKHGLVLLAIEVVIFVGLWLIGGIAAPLGCLIALLTPLLWVVFLILHIVCIVKAVNGERFLIPGVSQYADRF